MQLESSGSYQRDILEQSITDSNFVQMQEVDTRKRYAKESLAKILK
ncbi:MAG: hypothetical protein ACLTS6_06525 [Anaerobutyricum sp.]